MSRPYLAIFSQLFTYWNCRSVLELKLIYFHAIVLSLFTLKYVCLRIKPSLHSASFSFCGVHVCAPFVRIVTCNSIIRQRPQHTHGPTCNNGTTGLCNPLLGNSSVNTLPRMCNYVTLPQQCLAIKWRVFCRSVPKVYRGKQGRLQAVLSWRSE
jgi:hypothetical protein